MRLVVLLFAAAVWGSPQTDTDALLQQARVRLQAIARGLERYVCVETVSRNYYRRLEPADAPPSPEPPPVCGPADSGSSSGATRELESTDRVRLEVTVAHSRELHSWPGATGFDTRDVDELIRDGPVSTGSFGAYLSSIFDRPGVTFHFQAERLQDGHSLLEYAYSVPMEASLLKVKTGTGWTIVPYEGEFELDRQSLTLTRLTIRIKSPPPDASFCRAATTLDYQTLHIGDSDVLLPRQSQLEIVQSGGRETRNDVSFANCREYQAESELVFSEPADAAAAAAPRAGRGRLVIPIGLPVTLALENAIDTDTAATGDAVEAKVVKPVRRPGSKDDVIPAGAVVRGRIRRVEHHFFPKPYFLIAIAFNRVEVQGALSPFAAHSETDAALAKELGANLEIRASGIWYWDVGTFLFPSAKPRMVMPAGFESKWFTLATGR
jgi:hypothetical protein